MRSEGTTGWTSSKSRRIIRTITVHYECGCSMDLSEWGNREASDACKKHLMPVIKIVRIEEYF